MNSIPQRLVGHITAAAGGEKAKAIQAVPFRQTGAPSPHLFYNHRSNTMNQSELILTTAQVSGLSKKDVEHVLKTAGDVITAGLLESGEAVLPGLGKLVTQQKPAREGRNPATGEALTIAAHKAVKFRPAKTLKDAVAG